MDELIKLFNNEMTHIEVDTVNQKENGETDYDFYSYTVMLIENKNSEIIDSVSIDTFDDSDVEWVSKIFLNSVKLKTWINQ